MANPSAFDGARLLSWARRSANELERRRVEINELNVFPVPDSDTGSNMAHTMAAAVQEADKLDANATSVSIAEALAVGSMRGARGNSGVVLSQVIRGVAQSVSDEEVTGAVVAQALAAAVKFVDRAIADPVEGTVVTVLRAAANAAAAAVEEGDDSIHSVATAARDAARVALSKTPSQLEALRTAGVVDAGGTGLVILLEQLLSETDAKPGDAKSTDLHQETHGASAELEVMFLFDGPLDKLERALVEMGGTSLVTARAGESTGTVHVHSTNPGALIETAFGLGAVTELRLEVLPSTPVTSIPERLIVAVTPSGSLAELYLQAGAETVAPAEDIVTEVLAVIRSSEAREVILLPNGLMSNRNLVAIEKAVRVFEQTFIVLPTVRLVSAIAALAVYDAAQPLATVAFTMSEAAGAMRTAVIRHAHAPAGGVASGELVVTAYGETLAVAEQPQNAVMETCKRLLEHGGELVSVLFDPKEITELDAELLSRELGAEVMVFPADGLGAVAEIGVE